MPMKKSSPRRSETRTSKETRGTPAVHDKPVPPMTEQSVLQRQKQINLGKRSQEYTRYISAVPKSQRNAKWRNDWHPSSPSATKKYSTRCFSGLVRAWRRQLHLWGNISAAEFEYLKSNPSVHPTILLKKRSDFVLNSRFCVAPVYENIEILALSKSAATLSAAAASSCASKRLAQELLMCPTFDNKIDLPVVFLPLEFRCMQLWPVCLFLKEEDFIHAISSELDCLKLLQKRQFRRPQILGVEIDLCDAQHEYHPNRKIIDKQDLHEILRRCSLSDNLRCKQMQVKSFYAQNKEEQHYSKVCRVESIFCDDLLRTTYFYSNRKRF